MRKPKRLGVAVDMTPMVDVAFLLLIFFMTTTTFKPPEEITIDLPTSLAKYKVPESGVLLISLTRDGQFFGQEGESEPLQRLRVDQVADWVRQGRMRKGAATFIIVRADKNCEYGYMQDLMDQLQVAAANRFVLMTTGEGPEGESVEPPAGEKGDVGRLFPSDEDGRLTLRGESEDSPARKEARWVQ